MPRDQETRDQETSIGQAPARSDPFRAWDTGPDGTAPVDGATAAAGETAGSSDPSPAGAFAGPDDIPGAHAVSSTEATARDRDVVDTADTSAGQPDVTDGMNGPGDGSVPPPEGEWVAGSRGPSATVPSQPGHPATEDLRDDPGTRAASQFGEQAVPSVGEDHSPAADTAALETTPSVDADSDPSMTTPPAMDAGTEPLTGTTPGTDTAQLGQPARGAHAAPADTVADATGTGQAGAGAAFVTDADGYRASWVRIQSGFVDDPHGSVTEAADLIAQITGTLVSAVQERERSLRGGWDSGGADTEVLRNALREYRSFFERLMEV